MKKTKMEKGITLVALIITVLVLMILAGVAIGSITGNDGIITQAKSAKSGYEAKRTEEEGELAKMQAYLGSEGDTGNGGTTEKVDVALGSYVTYEGTTWRVLKNDSSSVELVTNNTTSTVTIGGDDYSSCMNTYSSASGYMSYTCQESTGVSSGIRNVNAADFEAMKTLGIAGSNADYWINECWTVPQPEAPFTNCIGYYVRYATAGGELKSQLIFYGYDPQQVTTAAAYRKATRAVLTLSAGALDNVTGSGTSGQPYVLN